MKKILAIILTVIMSTFALGGCAEDFVNKVELKNTEMLTDLSRIEIITRHSEEVFVEYKTDGGILVKDNDKKVEIVAEKGETVEWDYRNLENERSNGAFIEARIYKEENIVGYSLIRVDLLKTGNYKAKEIGSAMSTNKNYSETEINQIIEKLKKNNPLQNDLSRDDFVFLSFWRATGETFGKHYPLELYAPSGSYTFVCTADGGMLVGNEDDIFESGEIVRWRGEDEEAFVDIVVKNGETAVGYAVVKFTKNNEKYNATIVASKMLDNPVSMDEVGNMIKEKKEK